MNENTNERKEPRIDVEGFLTILFKDATTTFRTTHPDELPVDDPIVKAIHVPYYSWIRVQSSKAERIGTPEAHLEMSLKVTPFLVEAGFTDPSYVEEVVNDFLAQDLAHAEELGLNDLVDRIQAKREELLNLL
ncbi:MAG: hypothetical protein ABIR46_02610 [Candidatus Saccharimonadales bacterium]